MKRGKGFPVLLLLLILEGIHFGVRWSLIRSPFFSEADYDQAIPGLMALHILRGDPQIMLWGQPRMGSLQAYLASFVFFWTGPSTLSLHLSLLVVSGFMLLALYGLGKKAGGERVGILAAAYWAIPPIFLSFNGIYAGGGHQEAVLLGTFLLLGTILLPSRPSMYQRYLAGLLGLLTGLGGWSSLLIVPFVLTAVIVLLGSQPRIFRSSLPFWGLLGCLVGSLPFWLWNYFHDFDTLIHLGGKTVSPLIQQLGIVAGVGFQTLLGTFWDAQSVFPKTPRVIQWGIGPGIYGPVLILAAGGSFLWFKRLFSGKAPFQRMLDVVIVLLWLFLGVRATGEAEDIHLTRYHLVYFVPMAVLTAWWLIRLFDFNRIIGTAAMILLVSFNLYTTALYLTQHQHEPFRPVEDLIRAFQQAGIRFCYGHNRISQVVTFESGETIIGADWFGTRNYDYLRVVDQAPLKEIAFLTHQRLGNPFPFTMEASLKLLGFGYQKKEIGEYVFFYDFRPPAAPLHPIPADQWEVRDLGRKERILSVKDRDLLTSWKIESRGEGIEIDLGRERNWGGFSLFWTVGAILLPSRFRVEYALDQRKWETIIEVNDYLPGMVLSQGRPRLEVLPVLQVFSKAQPARYLRITNLSGERGDSFPWDISEIFLYEAAEGSFTVEEQARQHLELARAFLKRWRDDPTGPHPLIPRLSMNFRKKNVDWAEAVRHIFLAMRAAPEWEEPYHLFGQALWLGELGSVPLPEKGRLRGSREEIAAGKRAPSFTPKPWTATASHKRMEVSLALDGDPSTRWSSGKNQEPGMFFQVDLGEERKMVGFSLFVGGDLQDYPRRLKVLISKDGQRWSSAIVRSFSEYAIRQGRLVKKTDYRMVPTEARFIRLLQTGGDPDHWWSIYEFDLMEEEETAAVFSGTVQ